MRQFLVTFNYDGMTLYDLFTASTAVMANAIFEREWPNAELIHIQIMN